MKKLEKGIDKNGIDCWFGLIDASLEEIFYDEGEANNWRDS
jgi:hypothetical protein